jgi:hypothetical protein
MNEDKSGKFRKYSYMSLHYPEKTLNILKWSREMGFYGLQYDEISYLYENELDEVPKDRLGFKKFRGSYKKYNSKGEYKELSDKFIINTLDKFKESLSEYDLEKQKKCGSVTQMLMENYILMEELKMKYSDLSDKRIMIHMFLNNIDNFPKCDVCGSPAKERLTNTGFRKTCSELCRRKKEQSYKLYIIIHKGESIRVQGYERFVVPEFLKKYKRNDLKIGFEENSPIEYFFNGSNRYYYPDLYIVSENRIIEVKSDYSLEIDYDKNIAKKNACIAKGFKFEFHIWSEKDKKSKII